MTVTYDVIVIGGGAVGSACARELVRADRKVLVLDPGEEDGAAWRAAAGMLAPQMEARPEDPLFELGVAGRDRYRAVAPELEEATGISVGLWLEGIARVALTEDEESDLKAMVAWQRQQGHLCDWLDADEVRTQWPWMGETHGALWAPGEGAIDPQRLVAAYLAEAERSGVTMVRDRVTAIERRGARVVGVIGAERYAAEHVVVAAGAWSGRLGGLPRPLTVEPVRGQMAALPWPEDIDPTIIYRPNGYLLSRDGEAIVGSTMEYVGFATEVSSAGLAQIFSTVTSLCPALARLDVNRTWSGLRPVTPDGLPILGRAPETEGLWYATGHGRNGILLAGITGLLMAQLIAGEPTLVEDLSALDPARFWRW